MIYEILLTRLYKSMTKESFISYFTDDKYTLYGVINYILSDIIYPNISPVHTFTLQILDKDLNIVERIVIDENILDSELFSDKFLMEFKLVNGRSINRNDIGRYGIAYNSCDCLPDDNVERLNYYHEYLEKMKMNDNL